MMLLIDLCEVLTPLEVQWLRPVIEKYVHSLSQFMSELLSDAVWEIVANLYSILPIERVTLHTMLLIDGFTEHAVHSIATRSLVGLLQPRLQVSNIYHKLKTGKKSSHTHLSNLYNHSVSPTEVIPVLFPTLNVATLNNIISYLYERH